LKIAREEALPKEIILNIELEAEDVEPYLERAYRSVVNRIRVPGFRLGKAPRSIVESLVGREHLLHEALGRIVTESVDKAVDQESIEAYIPPEVDVTSLEPLSIKATVPLEPQVSLGDYQSLRIERETTDITDQHVDDVLVNLRRESAPWEPVDRAVRFDDQVIIDVEGTVDGRSATSEKGIEFVPTLENKLPLPGFSVYLEGAKKGESKEFTLKVPEDYADSTLAEKECRFQVEVHEIKHRVLADLDDEFAKGVGQGFENLEALKDSIRESLTKAAESETEQKLYEESLKQVLDDATVEMSDVLVEREVERLWEDRSEVMKSRKMDMDTYLQQIGKSEEELKDEMRPGARERLIRSLVIGKLAREEGVEVDAEEVNQEIEQMMSLSGSADKAAVKRAISSESVRGSVESNIKARKAVARLAEIVQGKEEATEGEGLENETQNEETEQEEQGGNQNDG
jgi:trigger factor